MISTILFAAVLASPGQTVLLDFHSDSCAPCVSMEPVVRRLMSDGFDVRRVNVDREQQLVRRFGVDRIPTFVLVSENREVDRVVGPASYERLRQMIATTGPSPASTGAAAVGTVARNPNAPTASQASAASGLSPQQRALHASVRLRVEDPTGNSFGTGTIIDARNNEALVMTCGHLFRDSSGQGRIQADLFAPGSRGPVPGKLLSYDLKSDVALVIIWPGIPVTPVSVAPENHQVRPGDQVFSIGCDRGADATIRQSQVTALNKYLGPANIEVAGQPVIGRSGGGLFTADGQLIGICNLADPKDDEGIYAALSLVHDHLAANLPRGVLQNNGVQIAAVNPPAASAQAIPLTSPPSMAPQMPTAPRAADSLQPVHAPGAVPLPHALASLVPQGENTELIFILRSKDNPTSPGRVVVIDRPSRDLLDYLAAHEHGQRNQQPTVLQAGQSEAAVASLPDRSRNQGEGQVLRGQSER
ncbi:MAG: trypsin-like peptidase domain-containing protein [Pirellulaceae bacterium]|nr:trypsin-like peptidase domain-containing protein [Pirellulaceae bacterium]